MRLGPTEVPSLVVHPEWEGDGATGEAARPRHAPSRVPLVLWMHGRTAFKELDPGRYLRWVRAGIGGCAVDLPGHGERFEDSLQSPEATLRVVSQMVGEIDGIVAALEALDVFDSTRLVIGGMSAGGMVTLARLCRPHPFRCATVEATTGSWRFQSHRAMWDPVLSAELNPIAHLDGDVALTANWEDGSTPTPTPTPTQTSGSSNPSSGTPPVGQADVGATGTGWRDIPLQAIHARHDEWVALAGQVEFIEALRARSSDPSRIELVVFERTGAPSEHVGFGRHASEAKDQQLAFLHRWLTAP